ncbi:MAG: molybdate ABC transporter substrate-binding protein [Acidimicrobiales bacterium]|nr:molybdate ABC transporter substrate-binding protein [Acidimicrobiales bacterium]
MSRTRAVVAAVVAGALAVAGCGSDGGDPAADIAAEGPSGAVTVLAAASLTDAFAEVAAAFEAAHPEVTVALSFDGSSALATSIVEGGVPADVFASADETTLQRVVDADLVAGPAQPFATNALQIVVAEGNPLGITGLADLADVALALCDPAVPCGRYAAQAFARAGLSTPRAGDQGNVKGVLTQVQLGEADAGIVYVTDGLSAEGVDRVDVATEAQVVATYPVGVLAEAPNPVAAGAFVAFLVSPDGQAILERFGFGRP